MRRQLKDMTNIVDMWDSDFDWATKDPSQLDCLFQNSQQIFQHIVTPLPAQHQIIPPQNIPYEENIDHFFNNSQDLSSNESPISSKQTTNSIGKNEEKPQSRKRPAKQDKSCLYSKNYREKKKQLVKSLSEENTYLKKKVNELQNRLREKQLELDRIKCGFNEDHLSIQNLNEEVMKRLSLIVEEQSNQMKQKKSDKLQQKQRELKEWKKLFENEGMGEKKTIEILEYYTNEFLENVLRDRQKFLVMQCLKPPQKIEEPTPLLNLYFQVLQPNQEQLKKYFQFQRRMGPVMTQLKVACQQFYKCSKKVIQVFQRIHLMTRNQFSDNVQLLKKRFKTVLWFQVNQHRKEMRQMRAQWISIIKNQIDHDEEIFTDQAQKKRNLISE